ncbi:aspartyl protease family protein [Persicobacter sp. CCB-QB2]|uniref:aspartyl protease family protein n=1 Tax=Persicobacter sp. CCB-QB2 TaxID=1561025 RepID=UPI0006A9B806|nr:aspartyl protease family protein [Persicobacter sp. CCB-QB2]
MRKLFSVLFFFLLTTPLFAQQRYGFHLKGETKRYSLPFEIKSNLIIVKAQLNGFIPLNFIIDTGVRTTIITDITIADILGLKYQKKITLYGANRQPVNAYISSGIQFASGKLMGNHLTILVLDKDPLNFWSMTGTVVHGILGYDLLSRFVTEIDYDRKMITFHRIEDFQPPRKATSIPISVDNTKIHIEGDVHLENRSFPKSQLMIDTGASTALTLEKDQQHQLIAPPQKNIETHLGVGISGMLNGWVGLVDSVSLSHTEIALDNVVSNFVDEQFFLDSAIVLQRNGTIGGEILSRFHLWIDYYHKEMYLKKSRKFNKPYKFDRSGLTLHLKNELSPKIYVEYIAAPSPAAKAGLQKGDQILSVNYFKGGEGQLGNINNLLQSRRKRKIKIKYKRGEETFKTTFYLEDLI